MVLIEIILALAFIFFLLSTMVSGINEIFAVLLNKRGRELKRAITLLLPAEHPETASRFFAHPLINVLKETPKADSLRGMALHVINFFRRDKYQHRFLPSYIDKRTFAKVLGDVLVMGDDVLARDAASDNDYLKNLLALISSLDEINFGTLEKLHLTRDFQHPVALQLMQQYTALTQQGIPFGKIKENLIAQLIERIEKNQLRTSDPMYFQKLRINWLTKSPAVSDDVPDVLSQHSPDLATWHAQTGEMFDQYMDRVSGWYKKRSHTNIFWWSVVLVVFLNIDTIEITKALYHSEHVRAYVVAQADSMLQTGPEVTARQAWALFEPILSFRAPWKHDSFPAKLPGWFTTILAISFGAPFWFDFLSRFAKLRGSGTKPGEQESSES